jgi:Zn-dependent protease
MANYLGDPTAKNMGRLTLNPLKHMDLVGTVLMPLFLLFAVGGFLGWAKPVPYNPYNLRDRKYGSAKVGFAGPAGNLLIALIFGILIRFLPAQGTLFVALTWIVYINIFLALFNLIPIPPLDGSKLLKDLFPRSAYALERLSFFGIFLAIIIAIMFLSSFATLIYYLITGQSFLRIGF